MASGSRARGQEIAGSATGGDALDVLTNPDLARLSGVELVLRLHRDGIDGSDFADVALVLAARERRLAVAEDQLRAAGEAAAGRQETIRALELRAANAEALAWRNSLLGPDFGGISGGERAVAREDDHQSRSGAGLEHQIGAGELTGGEIWPRDLNLTASETIVVPELPDGEIEATPTPAEVGDNMPRPSPLRRIGATLPAASSMPDEVAEERAVERVVADDVAVRSSHVAAQAGVVDSCDEVSEAVAGNRKKEPAAAFVSQSQEKEAEPLKKKKKKPAGGLGVDSEDSDSSDSEVEETEEELWKKTDNIKAHVAAWEESIYDAADAAQGTLQAATETAATPPPVEDVQTVIEADQAMETSEATVARLQEQIILCEKRLEEIKNKAEKTEERLCAEITECKEKASKTEALLRKEIMLARSSAVTELEVWKHNNTTEAQAQVRAASMTVARRLRDEIEALKHKASSETETRRDKTTIAKLQEEVDEVKCKLAKAECWIRVSNDLTSRLEEKIEANKQDGTMIEEDLRAKIRTLELKVNNLEARGSNIGTSDRTVAIDEHDHSRQIVPEIGAHRVVPKGAPKKLRRQKGVSFYDFPMQLGSQTMDQEDSGEEA